MNFVLLTKVFFSSIEAFSLLLLSFSIFRIPLKYSWQKSIWVAIVFATISIYQREFLNLENYAVFTGIVIIIIFIRLFIMTSTWYSILICLTGYILFGIIQTSLVLIGSGLHITDISKLSTDIFHGSSLQLITALIIACIIYWIQTRKIGFMFIVKKYSFKESIKGYNFYISAIIILSAMILQLNFLSFQHINSMMYFLVCLTITLFIALVFTYKKNKQELSEKYERNKSL